MQEPVVTIKAEEENRTLAFSLPLIFENYGEATTSNKPLSSEFHLIEITPEELVILSNDPEANAHMLTGLGQTHLENKDYDDAIKYFDQAIERQTVYLPAWQGKAEAIVAAFTDESIAKEYQLYLDRFKAKLDAKRTDYTEQELKTNYENLLRSLLSTKTQRIVQTVLSHENYSACTKTAQEFWQNVIASVLIKIENWQSILLIKSALQCLIDGLCHQLHNTIINNSQLSNSNFVENTQQFKQARHCIKPKINELVQKLLTQSSDMEADIEMIEKRKATLTLK